MGTIYHRYRQLALIYQQLEPKLPRNFRLVHAALRERALLVAQLCQKERPQAAFLSLRMTMKSSEGERGNRPPDSNPPTGGC
jgi:hypothetical protein